MTSGPNHHFFGYYGIPPWNASQSRLVCLESGFQDHLPGPDEPAGIVVLEDGRLRRVGETRAWNLQQGAMIHWNPLRAEDEILFNDRRGDDIVSGAIDVRTGARREFPRAVSAVSRGGRHALCLSYGRLTRLRPVVGYKGAKDPNPEALHPEDDGVFLLDLQSGESRLVVPIAEVYRRLSVRHPELKDRAMWFNHTVFNKDDTRFFFLARCWTPQRRLETAMFTAKLDGSDLREVVPFGRAVSHFEWRDERQILATFKLDGERHTHVLFTDGKGDYRRVGDGALDFDGHCSFAPDGHRIVTDRGHGETQEKSLILHDLRTGRTETLGRFYVGQYLVGDLRCDLHPRWSRTGHAICFDALAADGTRQLHVAEL